MKRQQGVALALLLWMVAALTLLVSGVVALSRTDVQLTSLQLGQARASAAAGGAAHLLMRDLVIARSEQEYDGTGILVRQYTLDDMTIRARGFPVNGLVNLNAAPAGLLMALFRHTGGMSERDAERLAERVVQWRGGEALDMAGMEQGAETNEEATPAGIRTFAVPEDLFKVPGVNRELYGRIRRAIHTRSGGQSGVNPAAAPEPVLMALAGGDSSVVDFVVESRQDVPASGNETDYAGLAASHLSAGTSAPAYCLEIEVTVSENRVYQQRIWVDLGSNGSGQPWRITRKQPVTVKVREGEYAG